MLFTNKNIILCLTLLISFVLSMPVQAGSLYVYYKNGKKVYSNTQPQDTQFTRKNLAKPTVVLRYKKVKTYNSPHTYIYNLIHNLAPKYNIEPSLAKAIIKAESNFNPKAVSKSGAQGLMQLMPKTAKNLNVRDSFDPEQNIRGGLKLLRELLSQYSSLDHVLAAYNAGPVAVKKYKGIPPYQETIDYVKKVRHYYQQFASSSQKQRSL